MLVCTSAPDADGAQLAAVLAAIDAANARDPKSDAASGQPEALLYGQRMSATLAQFAPSASHALQIAVRAQHIERWVIPRATYPQDRPGYHRWRRALAEHHAQRTGDLMQPLGYGDEAIARVQSLLRKERLKQDLEAQTLEDVACLVFIQHHLAAFAAPHESGKVSAIIQKTWAKMSDAGHMAALALPLDEATATLVQRALMEPKGEPSAVEQG